MWQFVTPMSLGNLRRPWNFQSYLLPPSGSVCIGEERIDTGSLLLRYRVSREVSGFVSQTSYDTSLQQFDNSSLVGFAWVPNTRSRVVVVVAVLRAGRWRVPSLCCCLARSIISCMNCNPSSASSGDAACNNRWMTYIQRIFNTEYHILINGHAQKRNFPC